MTHDDIIKKHFGRSLFGYDPIEVDRFLDELIRELDCRDAKIDELIREISELEGVRAEKDPEEREKEQIKILIMPENAENSELPAVLRKPVAKEHALKAETGGAHEAVCEEAPGTESGGGSVKNAGTEAAGETPEVKNR